METLKFRVDGSSEWHGITAIKGDKGDKGEQGHVGLQGIPGKDGYTPIKGVDYWTESDKLEIKEYIDSQLGVIENGTY